VEERVGCSVHACWEFKSTFDESFGVQDIAVNVYLGVSVVYEKRPRAGGRPAEFSLNQLRASSNYSSLCPVRSVLGEARRDILSARNPSGSLSYLAPTHQRDDR
jgi:hypothetical protein